ncbi:MAG: NnrS family protein [Rhodanobacteraceae bacterium]
MLGAAPHRLMFFAGACAVLVSMLWWALLLGRLRFGWGFMPLPPSPMVPGWAHAMMTQYGMLPMFMFGFLLTVFPRWMGQPALTTTRYVPVGIGILGGYLLVHAGLLGSKSLLAAGFMLMLAGYVAGLVALGGVLWRSRLQDRWALSAWCALALGAVGLAMFLAFILGADGRLGLFAVHLGTFAVLLPVYFTICHRMIPFFSSNVATNYQVRRPAWSLPVAWLLLLAHLFLAWFNSPFLWLADLCLSAFFLWHWLAWQPWKCLRPGLLAALYLAFAWLPLAFILYTIQDMMLVFQRQAVLGRAPLHALAIGFFGSMLVAMVTRVTMGHSGRPLQMGVVAWLCFALLQIVALVRIGAAVSGDIYFWSAIAAFGWLLAFMPWIAHFLKIYLMPRADGRQG